MKQTNIRFRLKAIRFRCKITVFYPKNSLKPVPPSMSLEALFVSDNLTDSDSDGIDGGTNCNFICTRSVYVPKCRNVYIISKNYVGLFLTVGTCHVLYFRD